MVDSTQFLASNLPGGRGMGEPIRLMVDIPDEAKVVNIIPIFPTRNYWLLHRLGTVL